MPMRVFWGQASCAVVVEACAIAGIQCCHGASRAPNAHDWRGIGNMKVVVATIDMTLGVRVSPTVVVAAFDRPSRSATWPWLKQPFNTRERSPSMPPSPPALHNPRGVTLHRRSALVSIFLFTVVAAIAGSLFVAPSADPVSSSPLQQPPPTPPGGAGSDCDFVNCTIDGEQYTTQVCQSQGGQAPSEFVSFRATRHSATLPYRTKVCLVDYFNQEQACKEIEIPLSSTDTTARLIAPPNVAIWKVRWYKCLGEGVVSIVSNDCLYSCCQSPYTCNGATVCIPDECPIRQRPPVEFTLQCVQPHDRPCESDIWGYHQAKVVVYNDAPVCRRIQYWWEEESQCRLRDSPVFGITLPANPEYPALATVPYVLCEVLGLFGGGDRILNFEYVDLSSYPPAGGSDPSLRIAGAERCCPIGSASCTPPIGSSFLFDIDESMWNALICNSPQLNTPCSQ